MAHRGYSAKYPENTMMAFEKAYEAGADGIELDVHPTRDGELVIIHDETLERTTDGTGNVHDYTLQELRKWNAAARFDGVDEFCPIPTLREYLIWAKKKDLYTNIELKNNKIYYSGLEEMAVGLVKSLGMTKQVIFSSFNHPSLSKAKQLLPEVGMGLLCKKPLSNAGEYVKLCGVDFLHPESIHVGEKTLKNCRRNGVKINAWIVNEEEEIRRVICLGLDGIITDEVELVKRILTEPPKEDTIGS